MRNEFLKITVLLFMSLAVVSCKKAKNETEAKEAEEISKIETEAIKYIAEVDSSTVAWKGFKPSGTHNGTIKISEGYFAVNDGKITGGNFVIDMKTIKDLDLEDPKWNGKLVGHLSSADFFDVENNPFSGFAITGVSEVDGKMMVKGNLTIKNIKKNIEFAAAVTVTGNELTFKSEVFTIDRTEWDIKYKSGRFFDDLKDKIINDEVEFVIEVKAKKA